jgi:hypothetical protein
MNVTTEMAINPWLERPYQTASLVQNDSYGEETQIVIIIRLY